MMVTTALFTGLFVLGFAWMNGPWRERDVRLGSIPADRMTEAQKAAAAKFRDTRRIEVFGPFLPLLRSPDLMLRVSATGEYVRYNSALPPRLSELVIVITARFWSQPYEWSVHQPIALRAGVGPDLVQAIAEGRRPSGMPEDQGVVYDFCGELLRTHEVTDETYARALATLGEAGVIDLVGMVGHYSMLAMVLNVARLPPEPGGALLPAL